MKYDCLFIGPVSLDINIDCRENERRELGGAVTQAGFAAGHCGFHTGVFTKANPEEVNVPAAFRESGADLYFLSSARTCSIRNQYLTPDKERRICTSLAVCDSFTVSDLESLSDTDASVYCFSGLVVGDFEESLFAYASRRGMVALDAQGVLRQVMPDRSMELIDWRKKEQYLPMIHFLKADDAEARVLTGAEDRRQAARILTAMGAGEILITYNTEVLAYDGRKGFICPIRARNLTGRTGRGDTTFAGYINERIRHDIPESLLFATALVSLKMESPGPFRGTRGDVEQYIRDYYPDQPFHTFK